MWASVAMASMWDSYRSSLYRVQVSRSDPLNNSVFIPLVVLLIGLDPDAWFTVLCFLWLYEAVLATG